MNRDLFVNTIFEGKSKKIYDTNEIGVFSMHFEDETQKKSIIRAKISSLLFNLLKEYGIYNHFIENTNIKEHKIIALDMIPIKIQVFLYSNKEIEEKFSLLPITRFSKPLITMKLKQNDCVIGEEDLETLNWLEKKDINTIKCISYRVCDIFYAYFRAFDLQISDFTLEFGKKYKNNGLEHDIYIGNEVSFKNINFLYEEEGEDRIMYLAKKTNIISK